jgi:hypothetical protein
MTEFESNFKYFANEIEAMVERRMENTGESRHDAVDHVLNYLKTSYKHLDQ